MAAPKDARRTVEGRMQSGWAIRAQDGLTKLMILLLKGEKCTIIRSRSTRISKQGDVQVEAVNVAITTDADVLVEQGQMTHEQGLWYTYTTTADCPPGPARVIVTGLDLPGHEGTNEAILTAV